MRERLLRTLTALLLAASLSAAVAPVAAHAQSAGDQQYDDPLSGEGGGGGGGGDNGNDGQSGSGNSGSGQSGSGSGQSGSTGTGTDSGSTAGTQTTTPPATSAAPGSAAELPRTGFPVALLALAGAAMLGGGAALRRSAGNAR
ncbi:MAG TPA: LPXTG cell wall anchor domain-containing protein [Thermoleophilaceae bacterium]|nr:LPXTG cell wall anchor domain-containing protein [Thermoleophilaceae bacterium]